MNVNISLDDDSKWTANGGTFVAGSAFFEGSSKHLTTRDLCSKIRTCKTIAGVEKLVNSLSGFFTIIHDIGDKVVAAVDHARSIPLYYSSDGAKIGDSRKSIVGEINPDDFTPVAETEYLLARYVTGAETLLPSVRTLEAGTLAIIDKESGQVDVEQHTDYYPAPSSDANDVSEVKQQLRHTISQAIERLCTVASGRPIYLLLSGGQDSKLVLSELVNQDYSPVVALTFGRQNIDDVTRSQKIANAIGVERKYVEYDEETWSDWFDSGKNPHYSELQNQMDFFSAHWAAPAISELKSRGELPDDAIFVAGDTIASIGEHTPAGEIQSETELIEFILENHYTLWGKSPDLSSTMKARIKDNISEIPFDDLIAAYEQWEWKERQSKWMTQGTSIYSFWGYDWWLPLFDKEVMQAWGKLPVASRQNKKALVEISESAFRQAANRESDSELPQIEPQKDLTTRLKQIVSKSPLEAPARLVYHRYLSDSEFGTHPIGYDGMFGPGQPGEYYCGNQSHHSYRVMYATNRMRYDPPDAAGVPEDCELSIEKIEELPRVES